MVGPRPVAVAACKHGLPSPIIAATASQAARSTLGFDKRGLPHTSVGCNLAPMEERMKKKKNAKERERIACGSCGKTATMLHELPYGWEQEWVEGFIYFCRACSQGRDYYRRKRRKHWKASNKMTPPVRPAETEEQREKRLISRQALETIHLADQNLAKKYGFE
jgi:hypothetical protein